MKDGKAIKIDNQYATEKVKQTSKTWILNESIPTSSFNWININATLDFSSNGTEYTSLTVRGI